MNSTDELLLSSVDTEQALLGAILISNGYVLNRIDGLVTADDFAEGVHSLLFSTFLAAHSEGRAVDVALTKAALGKVGFEMVSESLAVGEYIGRLASSATTTLLAPDYAKTVREFADKRRLFSVMDTIRESLGNNQSLSSVASIAIDQLDEIISTQPNRHHSTFTLRQAAQTSVERMQWGLQNPGKLSGVSWGISDLDRMTNGLQRGEVTVLAGRPGMGKSALATSSALQTGRAGNSVILFSQEMTAQSLADRAIADSLFDKAGRRITYFDIARGNLSNLEGERVVDASRSFEGLPIRIDEQPSLSISQIAARARKYKQHLEQKGTTLDLVIVDHMHITKASERYSGNRVSEVTEISGGLKAIAKELHVPVLALAQLSRKVEEREDKRPVLADLRDSGSIEQDADAIIFLFREEYYLRSPHHDPIENEKRIARLADVENQLEVIVAKQRNGPTGSLMLFCDIACNAVRNFARAA